MPIDRVSFLLKKSVKYFLAFLLYLNEPAQPFADPKTSELEKPPTAPKNLISFRSSLPEIKSVI